MAEGPFKDHGDVRLLLMYSETLAHLIYAAADIVLVRFACMQLINEFLIRRTCRRMPNYCHAILLPPTPSESCEPLSTCPSSGSAQHNLIIAMPHRLCFLSMLRPSALLHRLSNVVACFATEASSICIGKQPFCQSDMLRLISCRCHPCLSLVG